MNGEMDGQGASALGLGEVPGGSLLTPWRPVPEARLGTLKTSRGRGGGPTTAMREASMTFLPTGTCSGPPSVPHTAARKITLKSKSRPFSAQNPAATPSPQRQAQAHGGHVMTCHLPDPSAYHPSPSPASHRSHFPFTASAACSAPCTLPHFYTSSFKGSPPRGLPDDSP